MRGKLTELLGNLTGVTLMQTKILYQSSNTQRVVAVLVNTNTVLISKEWRKHSDEDWNFGKGIAIPVESLIGLVSEIQENDDDRIK